MLKLIIEGYVEGRRWKGRLRHTNSLEVSIDENCVNYKALKTEVSRGPFRKLLSSKAMTEHKRESKSCAVKLRTCKFSFLWWADLYGVN